MPGAWGHLRRAEALELLQTWRQGSGTYGHHVPTSSHPRPGAWSTWQDPHGLPKPGPHRRPCRARRFPLAALRGRVPLGRPGTHTQATSTNSSCSPRAEPPGSLLRASQDRVELPGCGCGNRGMDTQQGQTPQGRAHATWSPGGGKPEKCFQ